MLFLRLFSPFLMQFSPFFPLLSSSLFSPRINILNFFLEAINNILHNLYPCLGYMPSKGMYNDSRSLLALRARRKAESYPGYFRTLNPTTQRKYYKNCIILNIKFDDKKKKSLFGFDFFVQFKIQTNPADSLKFNHSC